MAYYNTLTNEFGDRISYYPYRVSAVHKATGDFEYFKSDRSAKIWLNKKSGKAKKWVESLE